MSVMTPADFPNAGQNADPQQFVKDTNRWSYHLANDPYGGAAGQWAKQFYDNPNIDPGQAIQSQIGAFRNQYGSLAPGDDAGIMNMIATGQKPQAQQQTPTQSWNATSTSSGFGATGDALLKLLMGRAQQGTDISRTDPNVRAQVDPMVAQMERASRNSIDDAAERAGGRPYNIEGEQRRAAETLGQNAGAFESQVIGREIGAKRDEIKQALEMWGSLMSDDQRMQLQMQLAQMDDKYRYSAMGTQNDQFMREMALRWYDSENNDFYRRTGI